jgi:hypothetical protein
MSRLARHPEAHADAVRERVRVRDDAAGLPQAWKTDYGWLLRLDKRDGGRLYRDLPAGLSYHEVVEIRDREMQDSRYESAWIFQKGFESARRIKVKKQRKIGQ